MLRIIIFLFLVQGGLKEKVDNFINNYSEEYRVVDNNSKFTSNIEHNSEPGWQKKVTLESKDKIQDKYGNKVRQNFELFFYYYPSEKEYKKAFKALKKCFGTGCQEIKVGKNIEAVKIQPSVFIINAKSIIVSTIYCKDVNKNWKKFKKDFVSEFSNHESEVIVTKCGGPLKWL